MSQMMFTDDVCSAVYRLILQCEALKRTAYGQSYHLPSGEHPAVCYLI